MVDSVVISAGHALDSRAAYRRVARPAIRLAQASAPPRIVGVMPPVATLGDAGAALLAARSAAPTVVLDVAEDVFTEARVEHLIAADWLGGKHLDQHRAQLDAMRYVAEHVDALTVATEPLAELVRTLTDRSVFVLPDAVDLGWFAAHLVHRPPWADVVTIGWTGEHVPEIDLVPMAVAWGRIAQRYPDVWFLYCARATPTALYRYVPEHRFIRLPWPDVRDAPVSRQVTIGCVPRRETPFNACLSPVSAWEYALAGAAVVASACVGAPVGSLAANSPGEWELSLRWLLENATDRRDAQAQSGAGVIRQHGLAEQLPAAFDIYRQIASIGAPA